MTAIQNKASNRLGAISKADTTGKKGVHRYALTASNQSFAVPAAWLGNYVEVKAEGGPLDYAWAEETSPTALVYQQTAAVGTGNAAAGDHLASDHDSEEIVPVTAKRFQFISNGTTGFISIKMTTARKTRKPGP